MASTDEVQKLAALARLSIPEEQAVTFAAEFESILAYVSQLEELRIDTAPNMTPATRNVFRADGEPHASGAYTEKLAGQFPEREGDYLSVKQIIVHE